MTAADHLQKGIISIRQLPADPYLVIRRYLRCGVPVQSAAGWARETVHQIDWEYLKKHDFAPAEEVALRGDYERRFDGAIVTGTTDTSLLRKGKRVTQDACGTYIHTCRSYEGVAGGVVPDCEYEACYELKRYGNGADKRCRPFRHALFLLGGRITIGGRNGPLLHIPSKLRVCVIS